MTLFQPGTDFAGHRIVRLLGTGSVAAVYDVFAPDGARRALKVLKEDAPLASKPHARLGQEGEAIAAIDHVNVVRFHGAGVDDGRVWIRLELVEGPDLRRLLEQSGGSLPVERAVRILRGACEGVCAAHREGILHRDLRPENILVGPDDTAKVADFGWAKLPGIGVRTTSDAASAPYLYMAPERACGRADDPRSDVYAMGLVLHEVLSGAHPIAPSGANVAQFIRLQLLFVPPPLSSLVPGVPAELSDLVQRALSKDPADRCSMRELADGLALVLFRLDAPRRAIARGLPLPYRDLGLGLAKTEPAMAAFTQGGTIPMAAASAPPAASASPAVSSGREAVLPSPVRWVGPATLRSPVLAVEAAPPAQRASSAAPVERAAARPSLGMRASTRVAGVVGAALLLALLGVGWLWMGRGDVAPASAPPSASASAPVVAGSPVVTVPVHEGSAAPEPATSSSAPAVDAGAPHTRAPALPPHHGATPARRKLPFP